MNNINYQSPKRFSHLNHTGLNSKQLREQMESLGLPDRAPQPPSTFELFGSDENKYQPSEFMPTGNPDRTYVDSLEYAGETIAFRSLVKALAKKLTTGRAKPERALAYAEYFEYLSKSMRDAAEALTVAREEGDVYIRILGEYEEVKGTYEEQRSYERNLSDFDIKTMELEELQVRNNAELEAKTNELDEKIAQVDTKNSKLTALFKKFAKGDSK